MGKLYVLVGRSAVGKTTIQKMLAKSSGFKEIVSHTTRAKRDNEIDGVDYFFVSDEKFKEMLDNGEFLEYTVYNGWFYGLHKDQVNLSTGNYVCVLETDGLRQAINKLGKQNVVGIYLYLTDYWELLMRSLNRQPHATVDQCREMCRRFLSDFDTFKEAESLCVLKVNNINAKDTVDIILRNIKNGI